jgi:hypothetical protein
MASRRDFLRSAARAGLIGGALGSAGVLMAQAWRFGLCIGDHHGCPDCNALEAGCTIPQAVATRAEREASAAPQPAVPAHVEDPRRS